jgi:FlaA1/EpsC-like NDP-sugar epimerase
MYLDKLSAPRVRELLTTFFHIVVIAASLTAAFWLRFDFHVDSIQASLLIGALVIAVPVKMGIFLAGSLQDDSWRYAGLMDLARIFFVNIAASAVSTVGILLWAGPQFPRSIYVIDFFLCFLFSAAGRFCFRLYNESLKLGLTTTGKGILIYGAGSAGGALLREIRTNRSLGFQAIGFIDDHPFLQGRRITDLPVLGTGREIAAVVEHYRKKGRSIEEVVIAMPSASGRQIREAHANCRAAGIACRTVPGFGELLNDKYLSAQIRSISIDDLLGRKQIRLEEDRIQECISGKSILITGAGGSIGSELCRQIARFSPLKLIALDQAESELFKIDQELRRQYPSLEIIPIVADIRDIDSVEDVIRAHNVHSIYHSAAYKHVPMMELHVLEAVRNNIIGTWNLATIAHKYKIPDFLMISSDKAVNPTSVMGATKRIAELIVSSFSNVRDNRTKFVSVRFGNVLGSNGSVVPVFHSQIAAGGPVTVTHPEIRRYFMSIREAVQLVLQASTMGKGAEIFVLDMGEPVRILDLAHNMIQLAGLVPGEDIEIRFTGLRPGEKLFEELMLDGENMLPTYHDKIRIFKGPGVEAHNVTAWLGELQVLAGLKDIEGVLRHFAVLVPEYTSEQLKESSKTGSHGPHKLKNVAAIGAWRG